MERNLALRDTASIPVDTRASTGSRDMPPTPSSSRTPRDTGSTSFTGRASHTSQPLVLQHDHTDIRNGIIYGKTVAGFSEHAAGVMRLLHGMWETRHLCDLVINVNGQALPVHRLALAACSNTFRAKLCSQQPNDIKELFITGSSVEAAELVLAYIYTLELSLDDDIVDGVLSCALQLGVTTVVEACKSYLLQFNLDNALRFIEIAESHQLADVLAQIHGFICVHFLDIAGSTEFLEYDPDTLSRLLADDHLVVVNELDVFLAAQRWIEHNIEERLLFATDLLKLVRLVLIPPEDIALHVEPCQYIFQIPECHDMLYTALRYHALKYSDSYLAHTFQVPKMRRMKTTNHPSRGQSSQIGAKNENKSSNCAYDKAISQGSTIATVNLDLTSPSMILAIGGLNPAEPCSNRVSRLVSEYNQETNSWAPLTNLPDRRHHQGAVLVDKELYIIGGSAVERTDTGQNPTNTCYKFDLASQVWSPLPAMECKRAFHSVVSLEGAIYVLGGQDDQGKSLNTVECFEPSTNNWRMLPAMSEGKTGATAVAFQGHLYVIGGFRETATTTTPLSAVECYHPTNECWFVKRPFPTTCSNACAVVALDSLFVIGGASFKNMEGPIQSRAAVYHYQPDTDSWRFFTNLHVARHSAAAASIGSHIYVLGGLSTANNEVLSSVECLDIANGSWVTGVRQLPLPVMGLCACVDNDKDDI